MTVAGLLFHSPRNTTRKPPQHLLACSLNSLKTGCFNPQTEGFTDATCESLKPQRCLFADAPRNSRKMRKSLAEGHTLSCTHAPPGPVVIPQPYMLYGIKMFQQPKVPRTRLTIHNNQWLINSWILIAWTLMVEIVNKLKQTKSR